MEVKYIIECIGCDTVAEIIVIDADHDEEPVCCPWCGETSLKIEKE